MARKKKKKTIAEWIKEKSVMLGSIAAIMIAIGTIGTFAVKYNANVAIASEAMAQVKEIKETYTPLHLALSIQERVDTNSLMNTLQTLEAKLARKEKRRDRIKDQNPNLNKLPDDNTVKEEYDSLKEEIKNLKKKISKLEDKLEE